MYKTAKALHLIGLAMFLGSILGHISIGFLPDAGAAQTILFGRQAIAVATWWLTLPGLALLIVTGLFMTVQGRHGFGRRRWLTAHQVLAVLIALNAAFVLVPGGETLRALAAEVADGRRAADAMQALAGRESMFGAANLLMALAAIFVAVLKPGFGQPRH